jgi:hypothetical protein
MARYRMYLCSYSIFGKCSSVIARELNANPAVKLRTLSILPKGDTLLDKVTKTIKEPKKTRKAKNDTKKTKEPSQTEERLG